MPRIETKIDRESEEYRQNAEANVALAEDLRALTEEPDFLTLAPENLTVSPQPN